ncbi:uncharacterized protein LOC110597301 [Ictidomys tridecemlineatus]
MTQGGGKGQKRGREAAGGRRAHCSLPPPWPVPVLWRRLSLGPLRLSSFPSPASSLFSPASLLALRDLSRLSLRSCHCVILSLLLARVSVRLSFHCRRVFVLRAGATGLRVLLSLSAGPPPAVSPGCSRGSILPFSGLLLPALLSPTPSPGRVCSSRSLSARPASLPSLRFGTPAPHWGREGESDPNVPLQRELTV